MGHDTRDTHQDNLNQAAHVRSRTLCARMSARRSSHKPQSLTEATAIGIHHRLFSVSVPACSSVSGFTALSLVPALRRAATRQMLPEHPRRNGAKCSHHAHRAEPSCASCSHLQSERECEAEAAQKPLRYLFNRSRTLAMCLTIEGRFSGTHSRGNWSSRHSASAATRTPRQQRPHKGTAPHSKTRVGATAS